MGSHENLAETFRTRSASIAVIGQGYVGLPLAMAFIEAGFVVYGVDLDTQRVADLREGVSHIPDVPSSDVRDALSTNRYQPTDDYKDIAAADAVSICVPTPLSKTREPDVSYIRDAAGRLSEVLIGPCLVVLESTTYPGTTREVLVPILTEGGRELDRDVFVAFSPERVDPGNEDFDLGDTPKIVGGVTEASSGLVETLYSQIIEQVHVLSDARHAEMTKLLENTFRAVNIALVNELAVMSDRMNLDIWEVIAAASTKPFGFMPFRPGPGIGGHCVPLDPLALGWKAKSFGFHNRFIELASDLNSSMPRFVVDKLMRLLNERSKAIRGSRVLLVGVAYKPEVSDTRESPARDIWKLLEERGAVVSYHDPFVDEFDGKESTNLTRELLAKQNAVVIVTDHDQVDYEMIVSAAPMVFDTRGVLDGDADNVERL